MPEPIIEPAVTPVDPTAELATLRQVHSEVLTKRVRDKARIAELETASADLTVKLTATETALRDAVVGVPLRQMAESMTTTPSMFLEVFNKHFKVESASDGKLTVTTLDGKRLVDARGKDVPFERDALAKYLTETEPESERTIVMRAIVIASRASGAGTPVVSTRSGASKPAARHTFGLR